MKALLKGDSYEERLEQSKKEVERLAKRIRRVARVCESKRVSQILDHTREIAASTKKTEENILRIESMLKNGEVQLTDLGKCFQALLESSSNFNVRTGQGKLDFPMTMPRGSLTSPSPSARNSRQWNSCWSA